MDRLHLAEEQRQRVTFEVEPALRRAGAPRRDRLRREEHRLVTLRPAEARSRPAAEGQAAAREEVDHRFRAARHVVDATPAGGYETPSAAFAQRGHDVHPHEPEPRHPHRRARRDGLRERFHRVGRQPARHVRAGRPRARGIDPVAGAQQHQIRGHRAAGVEHHHFTRAAAEVDDLPPHETHPQARRRRPAQGLADEAQITPVTAAGHEARSRGAARAGGLEPVAKSACAVHRRLPEGGGAEGVDLLARGVQQQARGQVRRVHAAARRPEVDEHHLAGPDRPSPRPRDQPIEHREAPGAGAHDRDPHRRPPPRGERPGRASPAPRDRPGEAPAMPGRTREAPGTGPRGDGSRRGGNAVTGARVTFGEGGGPVCVAVPWSR